MRTLLAAVVSLWLTLAPSFAGDDYVVDRARSEAIFAVRYLLSNVAGRMRDLAGVVRLDPINPTGSSVTFSIKTASVDTGSSDLDHLLRSADFLDVATHPEITFRSAFIKNTATANVYQVVGELTLRGVMRRVPLSVEVGSVVRDGAGLACAAFTVRTTLNRKDYGITWNRVLDQGALLVGDDVEVTVHLEATRQPPAPGK
jgi:polyisoprenoid-binding protein YceI